VTCGFWEVWLTVDGVLHKSETMQLIDVPDDPVYRFRFTNTFDKDRVLYSAFSYHQFLYPTRWAWDRPQIERDTESGEDGQGNEAVRFSRTVARLRVEVADIPDYAIPFLASCGDLDTVVFEDMNGTIDPIEMSNTAFEARSQGVNLNIGVFTFDGEVSIFNGCQENFELE
jgi:hypothetical protein